MVVLYKKGSLKIKFSKNNNNNLIKWRKFMKVVAFWLIVGRFFSQITSFLASKSPVRLSTNLLRFVSAQHKQNIFIIRGRTPHFCKCYNAWNELLLLNPLSRKLDRSLSKLISFQLHDRASKDWFVLIFLEIVRLRGRDLEILGQMINPMNDESNK